MRYAKLFQSFPHFRIKGRGERPGVPRDCGMDGLPRCSERHFQRFSLERTDPEHGEAEDIPLGIDFLHDLIVFRFPEVAFLLIEDDFQVIAFWTVPDLQGFAFHRISPFFTLSVKYAVKTKGSAFRLPSIAR